MVSRDSYIQTLADSGPVHPDIERPFGPTVPSLFGMVARAYMDEYGATELDLAAAALHDRANATRHPNAHMRKPMDLEHYLASPMIADPLRLLDCTPVSDGGAAVVVTTLERARDAPRPPVRVLSRRVRDDAPASLRRALADPIPAPDRALAARCDQAGLATDEIDVALVYDCFTIALLINTRGSRLRAEGRAPAQAFRGGQIRPHGGRIADQPAWRAAVARLSRARRRHRQSDRGRRATPRRRRRRGRSRSRR